MKLKDIFSEDNMYSLAVGAGVVAAGAAVYGAVAVAGVGVVGTTGAVAVAVGTTAVFAGAVVAGDIKFDLELKFAPFIAGVVAAAGIVFAATSSNAPQANQELSAVSEATTVQMVQMSDSAVDPLRISFTTTVDPYSAPPASLSDNTVLITAPAYELKMT